MKMMHMLQIGSLLSIECPAELWYDIVKENEEHHKPKGDITMDKKRNFFVQLLINLLMGLIGAKETDDNGFVIGE